MNDETLARPDRLQNPLRPAFPPSGTFATSHARLRSASTGFTGLTDRLLDANVGPMARTQGFLEAAQHDRTEVLGLLLGGATQARRDQAVFMAAALGHSDAARMIRDAGISQDARESTLALAERSANREMEALFQGG